MQINLIQSNQMHFGEQTLGVLILITANSHFTFLIISLFKTFLSTVIDKKKKKKNTFLTDRLFHPF
jgi:hypothetical protein